MVLLVVKRDEENESNARVADAILVCACKCVRERFCFVDYVIDDVFPKNTTKALLGQARA